jgi:outer membrane usher protein PapC
MLNTLKVRHTFAPSVLGGLMSLAGTALGAGDIEFNTDVLDLSDRSNIDLSRFAHSGFILPGTYSMVVQVNAQPVSEQSVTFYPPDDDPKGSQACLSPALVEQLGLKATQAAGLASWRGGECLDLKGLPGTQVSADLATFNTALSIGTRPHAGMKACRGCWLTTT